jgi:hypothetical protein
MNTDRNFFWWESRKGVNLWSANRVVSNKVLAQFKN